MASIISLNKDIVLDYNSLGCSCDFHVDGNLDVEGAIQGTTLNSSVSTSNVVLFAGTGSVGATCRTFATRNGSCITVSGNFQVNSLTATAGTIRVTPTWSWLAAETNYGVVSFKPLPGTTISSNWICLSQVGTGYFDISWNMVGTLITTATVAFQITTLIN